MYIYHWKIHVAIHIIGKSGKDKGGPSKGGFLNNILFVCIHIPLISLHKYRSAYENDRLFRKTPLLGPPLS